MWYMTVIWRLFTKTKNSMCTNMGKLENVKQEIEDNIAKFWKFLKLVYINNGNFTKG